MKVTTFTEAVKKINTFLSSNHKQITLKFLDGAFLSIKKIIEKDSKKFLEIHTGGYDGTLTVNEGIEWIEWELLNRRLNGFIK